MNEGLKLFAFYIETLRIFGQLTWRQEKELLMRQILKLLKRGWDQAKIRNFFVVETKLYNDEQFKEAWKEAMRYYKRQGSLDVDSQAIPKAFEDLDTAYIESANLLEELEKIGIRARDKISEMEREKAKLETELRGEKEEKRRREIEKRIRDIESEIGQIEDWMDAVNHVLDKLAVLVENLGKWLDFELEAEELTIDELSRIVGEIKRTVRALSSETTIIESVDEILDYFGLSDKVMYLDDLIDLILKGVSSGEKVKRVPISLKRLLRF